MDVEFHGNDYMNPTISFMTSGGNPFSHLHQHLTQVSSAPIEGFWSTLELQPDLFAPQSFSVGVVVQTENDRIHYHLLSDFKKFDCIYGHNFPKSVVSDMLSQAEEILRQAAQNRFNLNEVNFGTDNLRLSKPLFTSGKAIDTIIDRLYRDVVVLEPHDAKKIQLFETLDTPTVRKLVNDKLKEIAALNYERIVLDSDTGVLVRDGEKSHHLDFNLKTSSACGSVVSAVYKTVQSIEMNLLRANLDLTAYCRFNNFSARGVFLMLPDQSKLEPKEWRKVEDVVGEQSWKLERDGFRVAAFDSPELLAKEVYDWAFPTI